MWWENINQMNIVKVEPFPFCMRFTSPITGKCLGELKEENGKLVFNGDADQSAKIFFECVIKEYNKNK